MDTFDFIIVGAGSAGCVLANRLSADPANRVLLLEAGGRDLNPWLHIPVGYFKTMHNPAYDWCYLTEPDPGIAERRLQWPRGKVLGGSSALNGLLYVRGQHEDYDRWAELGNAGWSFGEVLLYFKKSEDNDRGAADFHAVGGRRKFRICGFAGPSPSTLSRPRPKSAFPITRITMASARKGWDIFSRRLTGDFAGAPQKAFYARRKTGPTSKC